MAFQRIPRTRLIMSLPRDRELISLNEIVGGNHPLVHCTLGAWSGAIMHYLITYQGAFAQALQAMLKKQRSG